MIHENSGSRLSECSLVQKALERRWLGGKHGTNLEIIEFLNRSSKATTSKHEATVKDILKDRPKEIENDTSKTHTELTRN